MRIGETLVARGLIAPLDLDRALEEQRRGGGLLGDVLLGLGCVSEEALARVLAETAEVPFLPAEDADADPQAVALVPEAFARRHDTAPLGLDGHTLRVLQANPFDVLALDELQRMTGRPIEPVCGTRSEVRRLIDRSYTGSADLADRIRAAVGAAATAALTAPDPDIARLLEFLLNDAMTQGATDLHIEPEDHAVRIRARVDGVLGEGETIPRELCQPLVAHVKALAGLDAGDVPMPQDGRITRGSGDRVVDLRIATVPTASGERIAIRFLDRDRVGGGLGCLGFNRRNLALVHDVLDGSRGLILVAGPAGSGKTTTACSALVHLVSRHKNVLTAEEPVEYRLPSIAQMAVRRETGLTFAAAVVAILRQDPDALLIGEIRDEETGRLAIRAAQAGVLVLTTLPALDAAGAVPRLVDLGLAPPVLASSVTAVIAQRLLRVSCTHCRQKVMYPPDALAQVGLDAAQAIAFVRGRGCRRCNGTGYRGRTGVFEVLVVTETIRDLMHQGADAAAIGEAAIAGGMRTLFDDALAKAIFGETTLDEVLRLV
jgi:type II secretory ATPase GspE/PulE/Tfp pilus assembly ATPase PilB-like protein